MFYTIGVFETLFIRGFDILYLMFVVPPPEVDDDVIFACVCNLAGAHSGMAISSDF